MHSPINERVIRWQGLFIWSLPFFYIQTKHVKMRESVDFIKIKDYAVINLNNMIPIPHSQLVEIDINKEKDMNYRYVLQSESREINRQKIE